MTLFIFILIAIIMLFIVVYRKRNGENVYKYIINSAGDIYNRYAPYSYKTVKEKVKEMGQDYTIRQYVTEVLGFSAFTGIITYLYFYNLIISAIYIVVVIMFIPYLNYLRCKRLYSEFIFEQIQVYTTNTIMEFATTQAFVKSLEGVYESNILEDPVKTDVKIMIDMAYDNGTIDESIKFFNNKYDYNIVKNMHQLFYQITNEGARDAGETLDNMSNDIDMLVESVYRDRIDRSAFHKKFLQFGIVLYLMIMLVQFLLGHDSYIQLLNDPLVMILLHLVVLINSFFLLRGEKYYNEDVGAE
ncbi:putative uncharacterized protein [Firmicutes bacterium CAG:884]|nr:putative uncharacterized protein [Firmicutes bacterium CAG:884]